MHVLKVMHTIRDLYTSYLTRQMTGLMQTSVRECRSNQKAISTAKFDVHVTHKVILFPSQQVGGYLF